MVAGILQRCAGLEPISLESSNYVGFRAILPKFRDTSQILLKLWNPKSARPDSGELAEIRQQLPDSVNSSQYPANWLESCW
jgi:hypothetical protein